MLRDYQIDIKNKIYEAWRSNRNALAVLPTGAGKTVVAANIIHEQRGPVCAVAHRQELVCQISLALAREGVQHRIIGPRSVCRLAVSVHMRELGDTLYNPQSPVAVAGVDTLIRRGDSLRDWLPTVKMWFLDEAHHVLTGNKWGKAVNMFPNARGLGVTATPLRADGKGLGAHADGVFNSLCVGVGMRGLIEGPFLTDYTIYAPQSDIVVTPDMISANGDYNPKKLKAAAKQSHITGDVVEHYLKLAYGKLGVTFATDIDTAEEIAYRFNLMGAPAAVVSSRNTDHERIDAVERFRKREILQLVNVDIFGEGFDLPAIEVCSFARPTESYGLFVQQFGRALRPLPGKEKAIIIDHVGNIFRHGLPDAPRNWTLDRAERKSGKREIAMIKACPMCTQVYERYLKSCPWCGHVPVPAQRSAPEFVDGDLTELDANTLDELRNRVDVANMSPEEYGAELQKKHCPHIGVLAGVKRQKERIGQVDKLRNTMAYWAGRYPELQHAEKYKKFYLQFGIDVMSAQALPVKEIINLNERVENEEMGDYSSVKKR